MKRMNMKLTESLTAEMSARRAEQHGGKDPVKQEFFKENSDKRGGKKHIDDR